MFKKIGQKYGPFDLALIATSSYLPLANHRDIHCTPDNCAQIGIDINARNLAPIHWGIIQHGAEEFTEPGPLFRKKALEKGVPDENIWILKIGETRVF